jgi:hypothetical protein
MEIAQFDLSRVNSAKDLGGADTHGHSRKSSVDQSHNSAELAKNRGVEL